MDLVEIVDPILIQYGIKKVYELMTRLVKNVLICDYVHGSLLNGLALTGLRPIYAPEIRNQEVYALLPAMEGVIVNTRTPVLRQHMENCPDLRFIGRLGVGLDIIDTSETNRRGIHVINTPGANANAVAEHMFGMLLALFRKIPSADRSVKDGQWLREQHRGRELKGMTIGIIGFGNTGSAFAGKFANWLTEVKAYDKYKAHYADHLRFVVETSLEQVIRQSDVISFHVPLTEETRHMVDSDFLSSCKNGVVILNGSRGEVIDTAALVKALESGHVGGVCLDVLENEKPGSYCAEEKALFASLIRNDNVILSPHIAGWTHESKANIAEQILVGISDLYNMKKTTEENVS